MIRFSFSTKIDSSLSNGFKGHLLTATINDMHTRRSNSFGRAALFTFPSQKGSLTLEAAIALPFFIFVCIAFVFFCQFFYLHCEIQGSLFQAARYISGNVLYTQTAVDNNLLDAVCVATARQKVSEYSKDALEQCVCLDGGFDGLQFVYSTVSQDYVDLVVNYRVKLPYAFGFDATFPVVQRCRIRAWTGESGITQREKANEMVYITEHGTVYHRTKDCTHLKLTIRQVQTDWLSSCRNQNGGKYKACEKCAKEGAKTEHVYITTEGDRYHNTVNCSGLKRSVQQIPMSEIQGKSACARCCR